MGRAGSSVRIDGHEVSAAKASEPLCRARSDLVDIAGRLAHRLGLPRSTGQIYGLLFLSPRPLPLDELASLLRISKASASTGARQLLGWQAVRQVWVPGERRDHYEATADLAELMRSLYDRFFKPKIVKAESDLDGVLASLELDRREGRLTADEHTFCRERLGKLARLQKRSRQLLPVARRLL